MRLIAHRGLHEGLPVPENSASALAEAIAHPDVDGLECDLRVLGDGTPVVFHDVDAQRLTGDSRALASLDLRAFAALRLPDGTPPPTVEAALPLFHAALARPGFELHLELKPAHDLVHVLAAFVPLIATLAQRAASSPGSLVVSSFDARILVSLMTRPASARPPLAYLVERARALDALAYFPSPPDALHVAADLLREEPLPVRRWREAAGEGAAIRAYTVNDPTEARRLAALPEPFRPGALITDEPRALRAALATS